MRLVNIDGYPAILNLLTKIIASLLSDEDGLYENSFKVLYL
jgi:hypothetical protein